MKILVVGASGTIGSAVVNALSSRHEVIRASRNEDVRVDLSDPHSIASLYESVNHIDAVVSAAGTGAFKPLDQLTDEDFESSLGNKLMGQINLVRYGRSSGWGSRDWNRFLSKLCCGKKNLLGQYRYLITID